jgi:hypothetical protein
MSKRTPTVIERLGHLYGASRLLRQISEQPDADPGLELLAHVVHEETSALNHALELHGVHEKPCPSHGPLPDDKGGTNG